MRKIYILLAHCDDELFLHPLLRRANRRGHSVSVAYLVKQSPERMAESRAELGRFGISKIFFIGAETGAGDGLLDTELPASFAALLALPDIAASEIWTHDWEAGHPDHDACFLLGHTLRPGRLYTFSAYNNWKLPRPLFRVMQGLPFPGRIPFSLRLTLFQGMESMRSLFHYRTQRTTMLGLGPFLFYRWILQRRVSYQKFSGPLFLGPAHEGLTLRESRFGRSFADSVSLYREFLSQFT